MGSTLVAVTICTENGVSSSGEELEFLETMVGIQKVDCDTEKIVEKMVEKTKRLSL